jgi:hypothetical protein
MMLEIINTIERKFIIKIWKYENDGYPKGEAGDAY